MEPTEQLPENNAPKKRFNLIILAAPIILLVIAVVVVLAVFYTRNTNNTTPANNPGSQQVTEEDNRSDNTDSSQIQWSFNGEDWQSSATPPSCTTPLTIDLPVDKNKIEYVLYPGQVRGGHFKAHGGFILKNQNNTADVTLPLDAYLWRGSRYIEGGEVQYLLDFVAPCGIMMRFDHLYTLSTELAMLVEELPEPQVDQSATNMFSQRVTFSKGDIIATEVGFKIKRNASFDFGVYDLTEKNSASSAAAFAATNANQKETSFYGVCWLDYLNPSYRSEVKMLPGPGTEGKTSSYCN